MTILMILNILVACLVLGAVVVSDRRRRAHYREEAESLRKLSHRVGVLEQGLVPDYEAAKEAVKSVNDLTWAFPGFWALTPGGGEESRQAERMGGDAE